MYNQNYNDGMRYDISQRAAQQLASTVSGTMKRVYFKMTLALLVTAFTALFCAGSRAT